MMRSASQQAIAAAAAAAASGVAPWDEPYMQMQVQGLPPLPMLPMGPPMGMPLGMPLVLAGPPAPAQPPRPPPSILLPPMLRPRPLVIPAAPTPPLLAEPLPVRDPSKNASPLPPKDAGPTGGAESCCCRGAGVVSAIISGVVLAGVLLVTAARFLVP